MRSDVDALHVVVAGLAMFALSRKRIGPGKVLLSSFPALGFGSLLGGQRPTVEDEIGLNSIVAEEPHSVHCIFDISGTNVVSQKYSLRE